jgi:hypothetical protein
MKQFLPRRSVIASALAAVSLTLVAGVATN